MDFSRLEAQEQPRSPNKSPTWAPFLRAELYHTSQMYWPILLCQSHVGIDGPEGYWTALGTFRLGVWGY